MPFNLKKLIIGTTVTTAIVTSSILPSFAVATSHKVVSGDTLWKIAQQYKVSLNDIYGANPKYKTNSNIYVGDIIQIPTSGLNVTRSKTSVTFKNHTVVKGDDMWKISIQYGVPYNELLKLNKISESHVLNIGDTIKIPVYNVPVKPTPGPQYGELLDWWIEAQYVVPIGKVFKVVDFYTGKSWTMKRTIGANHSDTEPLTAKDAAIMKEVWGGTYSWSTRPVIVEVDNRRIAASASSMPHDIQYITNNNFNGHSDIHFYNSTRHKDGLKDTSHQNNVLIAAGQK